MLKRKGKWLRVNCMGFVMHQPRNTVRWSFCVSWGRVQVVSDLCLQKHDWHPSHPRRPRDGQLGREKRRNKSFQVQAEKPLGTDSHRTISKRSSEYWLLIGHKKCFVLSCPIGKQHLLSSFCEFVHTAIDSITACLAHAPKKCTQSGIFQFDINATFQNTGSLYSRA